MTTGQRPPTMDQYREKSRRTDSAKSDLAIGREKKNFYVKEEREKKRRIRRKESKFIWTHNKKAEGSFFSLL